MYYSSRYMMNEIGRFMQEDPQQLSSNAIDDLLGKYKE
jgi:hypothetical protein